MKIAVFNDYKFNNAAILRRAQDYGTLHILTANDIKDGYLAEQNPDLLVIPGGADLYYCHELNGNRNHYIRSYVAQGGHYMGFCAGAYYGCKALQWLAGTSAEISGSRELAFADITAHGPIHDFIEPPAEKGWIQGRAVQIRSKDGQKLMCHYHGGPLFKYHKNADIDVLASYDDLQDHAAAVIRFAYEKGIVTLASVHFEVQSEDIDAQRTNVETDTFHYNQSDFNALEKDDKVRRILQNLIFVGA